VHFLMKVWGKYEANVGRLARIDKELNDKFTFATLNPSIQDHLSLNDHGA